MYFIPYTPKVNKASGQPTYHFQKMVNLKYDDNVLHFLIEGTGTAIFYIFYISRLLLYVTVSHNFQLHLI